MQVQQIVQGYNAMMANESDLHNEMVERADRNASEWRTRRQMVTKLKATYQPSFSNKSMMTSFGATLSVPRYIKLTFGSIEAQGSSATVRLTERNGQDTTQITAFLRTNYPFGGRIGGQRYTLIGLISAVLRNLPGSVVITA
jgi:hypothetical protein